LLKKIFSNRNFVFCQMP